jgi:uncharacterized membrane protein
MESSSSLEKVVDNPGIDHIAKPLSKAVRGAFESAGPTGREIKDALHGKWLGHPLHPALTSVPLGAWTTALALDCAANGDSGMRRAATFAMGVGLAGALGAAVTGLTDWCETGGQARREGLVHGLLNVSATALMATSYVLRKQGSDDDGRVCAWTGYAIALGAAYLGGELVFKQRVGVADGLG